MKKILSLFLFLSFILISGDLNLVYSQYKSPQGSLSSTVSGSVGDFYLNLSGYIAPFASIVLTTNNAYLRATTSNQTGYFTISEVLVKKGNSKYCFDALDFKRLGESYSCLTLQIIEGPYEKKDIFLPPTLGLSRSRIAAGSSTTAYGYSMPGALVTLHFGGKNITTYADSTGYYQFVLKDVKAGIYQLYPTARLNSKQSLEPSKKVTLESLSWWEQFLEWLRNLWKNFWLFFTSTSFGLLWLAIPILILIIILIVRLWPDKFTFIYQSRLMVFFAKAFKRKKHLHHAWFMGY